MSVPATNPASPATPRLNEIPPTTQPSRGWLSRILNLKNRIVQVGIERGWWCGIDSFSGSQDHALDQPDLASIRYRVRVWAEIVGPVYALILIGVIFVLTHGAAGSILVPAFPIGSPLGAKPLASWFGQATPRKPIRLSLSN